MKPVRSSKSLQQCGQGSAGGWSDGKVLLFKGIRGIKRPLLFKGIQGSKRPLLFKGIQGNKRPLSAGLVQR